MKLTHVEIADNDREWDENLADNKYIAHTRGCDCCSGCVPVTPELISQHIAKLEEALEEARAIQRELN